MSRRVLLLEGANFTPSQISGGLLKEAPRLTVILRVGLSRVNLVAFYQ